MSEAEEVPSADIIRIMVATDNHLGYGEKDAIRGEDSFTAFEEILEMAVAEDVDFILLGGDLFHDATPSQNSLNKCLKLLRRHTFGDKFIAMEFLSDQKVNFQDALNQSVNYEDPNFNISMPVFSIHGNHDDPSGYGRLSSLDLLSTTGLINYFGRWTDLTKVEVNPILLRKGATQLALFGLSHIHDARLARLFENGKVIFDCPDPSTGDWFNLMVLHQNRADRGPKNYLPEEILPDFLHLVIWGHEHDCRIEPEYNTRGDFYVCQPGSSVPTSLADGESLPKHVALLEVYKTKFQVKPLPLQTVRPFIFESVALSTLTEELGLDEGDASNKVWQMAKDRVEAMIEKAKTKLTGHPKQPTLPLIRLRIIYSDEEQMFNAIRFGQQYNEKVANPSDMILFKKLIKKFKQDPNALDKDVINNAFQKMEIESETRVEDVVDRYFDEVDESKKLKLMPSKILSEMCYRLVENNDNDAAENIISFYKEKALEHLMEKLPGEDAISEELLGFKDNESVSHEAVCKMLDTRGTRPKNTAKTTASKVKDPEFDPLADDDVEVVMVGAKGRSRAIAAKEDKISTGTRGRGRGKAVRGGAATVRASVAAPTISPRSKRAMPQLDVSVGSTRASARQQTLLDAIGQRTSPRRGNRIPTYDISDDSSD